MRGHWSRLERDVLFPAGPADTPPARFNHDNPGFSMDRSGSYGHVRQILPQLAQIVGAAGVVLDSTEIQAYSRDESHYPGQCGDVLIFPRSTGEVVDIVRLAGQYRIPITPRGTGTGKSGGAIPLHGGIILCLARMNRIVTIAPENMTARVEPGVINAEFQKQVRAVGLFYPPDPASLDTCSLGGNVATNAGGPSALRYGVTRDYVMGLTIVTGSGQSLSLGRQTTKGVVGYDLTALLVGSEGTLGIVTEIIFKLLPWPGPTQTALILFADMDAAVKGVSALLLSGVLPRSLEFMDEVAFAAVRQFWPIDSPIARPAAILVELEGLANSRALAAFLQQALRHTSTIQQYFPPDQAASAALWEMRKKISTALKEQWGLKISEDICVPRSHIPQAITRIRHAAARLGFDIACYGHAGDGNIHLNILFQEEKKRLSAENFAREVCQITLALDGTISGEHGIGITKRDYLPLEQSAELISLQRQIKVLFDPAGILNPGKIFS